MPTAAEFIDTIITNALTTATANTTAASDAADDLIAENAGVWIEPPDSESDFEPEAVEPEIPTVADTRIDYQAELDHLIALLSEQLADFFATYYPLASDAFDEATTWLINTITNGGTGINTSVEDQVWQRSRERTTADAASKKAQVVTGYAAKGYFMPAGSMLKKMEEADYAGLAANGVASTSIGAKQLEIEIETIKFAIGEALKSRLAAMQVAADYIRAVATAPASAINYANLNTDGQARMMAAAANWYEARLSRDKLVLSSKLAEMGSRDDIYKHRRENATHNSQVDVQALAAAADVFARTASAALSSLNSIVSTGVSAFE